FVYLWYRNNNNKKQYIMKNQEKEALAKLAKEALKRSDVCKEWKNKILEAAPSLQPKELELGKWYRDTTDECALIFCGAINTPSKNYGIGRYGGRVDYYFIKNTPFEKYALAPEQMIFQALKKEAIRRGFKDGVKFKLITDNVGKINSFEIEDDFDFELELTKYGSELTITS